MRILYLDIDTLRPDHLGCYGYHRNTSPNLDRIAQQGVRFDKCYVSDAPCLPSRASMFLGQFGIHTGVVNHGGLCADLRPIGRGREFLSNWNHPGLITVLAQQNLYPVSVSPFADRHSAWWFCEGWREMYNTGKGGGERADEVAPLALDWLSRNAKRDNWLLHVNMWDPHTPYQTPEEFGNPFKDEPIDPWYTEELRQQQWNSFGPGSPQEPGGGYGCESDAPRQPSQIRSMARYRQFIDGYDCGIRYADEWCGRILNSLADAGVLDDTVVIITSDHGENQGELAVHGDHQTADHICSRVPMIIRWPGLPGGRVDDALHYQTDVGATLVELAGGKVPTHWDGRSLSQAFKAGKSQGRDYVVFSQLAWACQRSVRWGDYVYIRSYHTGLKNYPERMLFDIAKDPHETNSLAASHPQLADHGQALIEQWTADMMAISAYDTDPLWTVMHEGGSYHANNGAHLPDYCKRLRATGRAHHADFLEAHPRGF